MLQNKSFKTVLIPDCSFKTILIYEPKDMSDELLKVIGQYQLAGNRHLARSTRIIILMHLQ